MMLFFTGRSNCNAGAAAFYASGHHFTAQSIPSYDEKHRMPNFGMNSHSDNRFVAKEELI